MTSRRLKHVYNTAQWRGPIRDEVLERSGHQCEYVDRATIFGERCRVKDTRVGGKVSLLVDHKDHEHPDPFDTTNLQALCPRHSGMKDGGRAHDRRRKGLVR